MPDAITVIERRTRSRKLDHVQDSIRDRLDRHRGLGDDRSVRLERTHLELPGHVGGGVADVDLAAGDPVAPAFERERLGQPRDAVLGRRVGDRVRARDGAPTRMR